MVINVKNCPGSSSYTENLTLVQILSTLPGVFTGLDGYRPPVNMIANLIEIYLINSFSGVRKSES